MGPGTKAATALEVEILATGARHSGEVEVAVVDMEVVLEVVDTEVVVEVVLEVVLEGVDMDVVDSSLDILVVRIFSFDTLSFLSCNTLDPTFAEISCLEVSRKQ